MNQYPTIGRIVGFVLPIGHRRAGEVVPAMITRIWGPCSTSVQLTPFVDLANDCQVDPADCSSVEYSQPAEGDAYVGRTWHWLTRA